ncbi:MAG TPA: NIPSNAP family protein [Candidatus Acidoferrum sp.]|nr:NIPSNAP family protein [Candidatus Acidoferrum sp.]
MILVRDVFQLKFGKARDALTMFEEGKKYMQNNGHNPTRILTDLSGNYYTLVMESSFDNLAEYEKGHTQTGDSKQWHDWYQKFCTLVESGHREIFNVVQ